MLLRAPSMASRGPQDGQCPGHSCFSTSLPSLLPAVLPHEQQAGVHMCPQRCSLLTGYLFLPHAADSATVMLAPRLLPATPQLPSTALDWPFCEIVHTLQSQSQISLFP